MSFKRRKVTEKQAALSEREFLREVAPPTQTYELARPVRVVFRLSEAEAERLRSVCFERRTTTQGLVLELLKNAGVLDRRVQ